MTPREKILLMLVGLGLAVLAGLGLQRVYTDRSAELDRKYLQEQKRLAGLQKKTAEANQEERDWRAIGSQTLSMNEQEATGLFRDELVALARESGMPDAEVVLGSVHSLGRPNNGIRGLSYTVNANGTVDQAVDFLFRLYRQPYSVRCKSLSLKPALSKPTRSGVGSAPPRPTDRLTMSAVLETPILPSDPRMPTVATAELAQGRRTLVPRPEYTSVEEYRVINRQLFGPPIEVVVVTGPDAGEGGGQGPTGGGETGDRVKRHPDSDLVLARVLSSPRTQQVVLEDPRNRAGQDRRVSVGEPLYGGTLIFVYPTGAVSECSDGSRLFHPVALPLKLGRELTERDDPQVFSALAKLEQRLAGISTME